MADDKETSALNNVVAEEVQQKKVDQSCSKNQIQSTVCVGVGGTSVAFLLGTSAYYLNQAGYPGVAWLALGSAAITELGTLGVMTVTSGCLPNAAKEGFQIGDNIKSCFNWLTCNNKSDYEPISEKTGSRQDSSWFPCLRGRS